MAHSYLVISQKNDQQIGKFAIADKVIERIVDISVSEVGGAQLSTSDKFRSPVGVRIKNNQLSITVDIRVDYQRKVDEIAEQLQRKVLEYIEQMLGYHMTVVDVRVSGFLFR